MHVDARAAGPVDAWPQQNTARKMVGQPTARPPPDSAWPHIASGAPNGPFPATGYARGRTWTWVREESRRSCGRVEEPSPPWREAPDGDELTATTSHYSGNAQPWWCPSYCRGSDTTRYSPGNWRRQSNCDGRLHLQLIFQYKHKARLCMICNSVYCTSSKTYKRSTSTNTVHSSSRRPRRAAASVLSSQHAKKDQI